MSRKICKRPHMVFLWSLITILFLWYMQSSGKVANKTLQGDIKPRATTSKHVHIKNTTTSKTNATTSVPVHIKPINTRTTMKYYPSHKAHDYPLSVLPDPYIMNNKEACKNMSELKYIVLVISASDHFHQRNNIRQTWGRVSYYGQGEVKVVFILGRPALDITQKQIEAETRNYQDIVQGKFIDTYTNLTHKAVLAIRWVNEQCRNSKMVLKVDDDMVVNFFKLFKMITNGECCQNSMEIMCNLHPMGNSIIFRKDSGTKWKVDDEYFPNLRIYPFPYCDGGFLMIPQEAIPIMYETAKRMPFFWVDDVYLTGIVVSQINKMHLKHVKGIFAYQFLSRNCFLSKKAECLFIAGVSKNIKDSQYLWSLVLQYYRGERSMSQLGVRGKTENTK